MPRPPRPHFLSVFGLCLSQHLSLYLSLSVFLHLPVTGLIVASFFFKFVLSIAPLISPISARRVFIHVCSDVPAWDWGRTFLWQCHSRSALRPELQSHQARILSGIFWICDDISAQTFRREEISLPLISLMGRLSPRNRQSLCPKRCPGLFFLNFIRIFNPQNLQQQNSIFHTQNLRWLHHR